MFECHIYKYNNIGQVPFIRPNSSMQPKLGTDYNRSLGVGHSTRLPVGTGVQASTALPTSCTAPKPSRVQSSSEGNREAATEGSNNPSEVSTRPVCQPDICGSQEGWEVSASGEPKGSEQVYEASPLQDGRSTPAEGSPPEGGLDGDHRFKGCISVSASGPGTQVFSTVHVGMPAIPISVSSIRALHSPSSIYEDNETGDSFAAATRNSGHHISGRYVADGSEERRFVSNHPRGDHPVTLTGVHHKLGQIFPDTLTTDSLFGIHDRLSADDNVSAKGEGEEHRKVLSSSFEAGDSHGEGPLKGARSNDGSISGSPPSSTMLSQSPAGEELGICPSSVLRGSGCSRYASKRGVAVVESVYGGLEREGNPSTEATVDNRIGCFPARLGGPLRRGFHRRPVVTRRKVQAHKLSGTDGRFPGSKNLCQGQREPKHTTPHGQHNCYCICKPNGGNPLSSAVSNSQQFVAVVPTTKDTAIGRAPPGGPECIRRCRVTYPPIISRMEVTEGSLPMDPGLDGAMSGRPVCYTAKPPTSSLCELEARSPCNSNRCLRDDMVRCSGVRIPSILPGRQMSTQGDKGGMHNCANSTSVASTGVVPHPAGVPDRVPSLTTKASAVVDRPLQPVTSALREGTTAVGRMEGIRQRHTAAGISNRASRLILAGWSKATNTAYQSSWERWNRWCVKREIDPFSCNVSDFLDFLAGLYQEGLEHRTINSIRSAVSMTHCHVEGVPIGQHPLVSRLLKGVYNSRSPKPRYSATWDVDSVIHYLISLGENDQLTLKDLSQKTALLMALVEASRSSELQALDLRFRVYKPEGVTFRIPSLTKKRVTGAPPKEFFFASFPANSVICPVHCLRNYELKTAQFRRTGQEVARPLFISYIKPHKPVTSQRIAHWIKDLLGRAGIDTSVFKAHSVRGASTTAASNKGVALADILQAADWSSDTTFRRFYYRPTSSASFGRGVLNLGN